MKDKYDKAIEYLTAHPEDIAAAWSDPDDIDHGGALFQSVGCGGCLTQIRRNRVAADSKGILLPELTAEIRADERIPTGPATIRLSDLPVFAEWQRRIDKEIRGAQ